MTPTPTDPDADTAAVAEPDDHDVRVVLSLVSHTNVGKTTLARTLLQRDVGEVRDAAHVTQQVQQHLMLATAEGTRLELWDTPGFGDSLRLARRLASRGNPLGWFLTEVWDRFRDPSFWLTQRTLRHVMGQTDVVLYLVDASQAPEESGHLDPELTVLGLIGKPVLVLLNQLGPPPSPDQAQAELQRWRDRLAGHPVVRQVLAMDAFARCWVQEATLLQGVEAVIATARQPLMHGVRQAGRQRHLAVWAVAMDRLAQSLQRAAFDREALEDPGWEQRLRQAGRRLVGVFGAGAGAKTGTDDDHTAQASAPAGPAQAAMARLAQRLDTDLAEATTALIALHGLDGAAARSVIARLQAHFAVRAPVHEGKSAVLGGAVAGALAGLKADVASGGLTMGGGLLIGGALGALGGYGVARSVNRLRGVSVPTVAWTQPVLTDALRGAALAYLSVVHFGRGRGGWVEAEHPAHWAAAVDEALAHTAARRDALWARRDTLMDTNAPSAAALDAWRHEASGLLKALTGHVLAALYPDAEAINLADQAGDQQGGRLAAGAA